jgi:hypothetical protein
VSRPRRGAGRPPEGAGGRERRRSRGGQSGVCGRRRGFLVATTYWMGGRLGEPPRGSRSTAVSEISVQRIPRDSPGAQKGRREPSYTSIYTREIDPVQEWKTSLRLARDSTAPPRTETRPPGNVGDDPSSLASAPPPRPSRRAARGAPTLTPPSPRGKGGDRFLPGSALGRGGATQPGVDFSESLAVSSLPGGRHPDGSRAVRSHAPQTCRLALRGRRGRGRARAGAGRGGKAGRPGRGAKRGKNLYCAPGGTALARCRTGALTETRAMRYEVRHRAGAAHKHRQSRLVCAGGYGTETVPHTKADSRDCGAQQQREKRSFSGLTVAAVAPRARVFLIGPLLGLCRRLTLPSGGSALCRFSRVGFETFLAGGGRPSRTAIDRTSSRAARARRGSGATRRRSSLLLRCRRGLPVLARARGVKRQRRAGCERPEEQDGEAAGARELERSIYRLSRRRSQRRRRRPAGRPRPAPASGGQEAFLPSSVGPPRRALSRSLGVSKHRHSSLGAGEKRDPRFCFGSGRSVARRYRTAATLPY